MTWLHCTRKTIGKQFANNLHSVIFSCIIQPCTGNGAHGSTGIDQQPTSTLKNDTPQINHSEFPNSWQPLNGKWAQLSGVTGSEVPAPRTTSRQAQAGAQVGATSRVTGPLIVISKAQASLRSGSPGNGGDARAGFDKRPQTQGASPRRFLFFTKG